MTDPSKGVALAAIGRFAGCDAKSHRPTPRFRTTPGHEQLGRDVAFEKTRWQRPPGPCPLSGKPDIELTASNDRLPCQLPLLAGPEHGRTIPLADMAKRLSPCAEFMSTGSVPQTCCGVVSNGCCLGTERGSENREIAGVLERAAGLITAISTLKSDPHLQVDPPQSLHFRLPPWPTYGSRASMQPLKAAMKLMHET